MLDGLIKPTTMNILVMETHRHGEREREKERKRTKETQLMATQRSL